MANIVFEVRQWLTRTEKNPVPMRRMKGEIIRETAKAVHVKLHGFMSPSSTCHHCGKTITHPVSLLIGLGPVCGGHFHINPTSEEQLQAHYEELEKRMASVTWEGWLPKSHIKQVRV